MAAEYGRRERGEFRCSPIARDWPAAIHGCWLTWPSRRAGRSRWWARRKSPRPRWPIAIGPGPLTGLKCPADMICSWPVGRSMSSPASSCWSWEGWNKSSDDRSDQSDHAVAGFHPATRQGDADHQCEDGPGAQLGTGGADLWPGGHQPVGRRLRRRPRPPNRWQRPTPGTSA